jgi:mannitol-specific phosphotransferase system IIBC component
MKKTIKTIGVILAFLIVVYIGIFLAWFMLASACIDYEQINGQGFCGQDSFTLLVRKMYNPLLPFLE